MTTTASVLSKLKGIKKVAGGYTALCPGHDDKANSLKIAEADGKILLHCFAGCSAEKVASAIGLQMTDLFLDDKPAKPLPKVPSQVVATYDYQDEQGALLFQVVRYDPKEFRQRHRNGNGEWLWNLEGIRRVIYHLPDVLACTEETVYVVEGEKDADNLWKWGKPATTSAGGANGWKPEYAEYFKGLKVCIIPDKDQAGIAYAKAVAKSLQSKAREIRAIMLPGEGKDVSDWLEAGGDVADLESMEESVDVLFAPDKPKYQLIDEAIIWRKQITAYTMIFKAEKIGEERTGIHARISILLDDSPLGWTYLNVERSEDRVRLANAAHSQIKGDFSKEYSKEDLRADLDNFSAGLWDFHVSLFVPEELAGDEEIKPLEFVLKPFVLQGGGTIIFAPPGRGKSFSVFLWAVSVDAGISKFWPVSRQKVLYINLERSKESIRRRLTMVNKALGLQPTRPLYILNARGKSLFDVLATCRKAIKYHEVGMVVLDSISRTGLGDLNENVPGNRIIDVLSGLCPTWVAIGHTPRANETHMYGSVMQEAGADICVQLTSQVKADGTLGCGYQITKTNDTGIIAQSLWAMTFDDKGLAEFRRAKPMEFPEIEGQGKTDMETTIIEFVAERESGDATATEVARELGFNRISVVRFFTKSGKFTETRRVKQSVYYGLKTEEPRELL